jgi:hypothetical protein
VRKREREKERKREREKERKREREKESYAIRMLLVCFVYGTIMFAAATDTTSYCSLGRQCRLSSGCLSLMYMLELPQTKSIE